MWPHSRIGGALGGASAITGCERRCVRLAFAVAAHMEPEILIVDDGLSSQPQPRYD